MSHYEERLAADLQGIHDQVANLGSRVEAAFRASVAALIGGESDRANAVILGDPAINRSVRTLDRVCHGFIVRHSPHAGPLRLVSSVLRINVALERIGDYAVTIGRETNQLSASPAAAVLRDIDLIGQQSHRMLKEALDAFAAEDVDRARAAMAMATQAELTYQKVYGDLLEHGSREDSKIRDVFALLSVIASIGRVADQAKNICEETVFAATGETKDPKVYSVLFVDERNDCLSQLAEAYARKAFPNSGRYSSAGWNAGAAGAATAVVDPELLLYMDRQGMDVRTLAPSPLDPSPARLAEHHVVVWLEGDPGAYVSRPPYRTVLLNWDVAPCGGSVETVDGDAPFQAAHREISARIRELMETLRGPQAD